MGPMRPGPQRCSWKRSTRASMRRSSLACALAAGAALLVSVASGAQTPSPPPPASPRVAAPIDLTGYWVSVITEDWRWRMVTPAKGDYASVPINAAAKKVADSWDPDRDQKAGEACRGYGAPALMRQ